jgi:hypothetical protein
VLEVGNAIGPCARSLYVVYSLLGKGDEDQQQNKRESGELNDLSLCMRISRAQRRVKLVNPKKGRN